MTYTRPVKWEPGTFLKACDICGIRFRANQLVRSDDGKFRCVRWCAEQTQFSRDRISAESARRREAPPPPYGTPYLFKDDYSQEGILFNFLAEAGVADSGWAGGKRQGAAPAVTFSPRTVQQAPFALTDVNIATSAGETMRYLYGLIVENKRPTQWISRAKLKLRELADWLLTIQVGFGTSPTSTKSTDAAFGSAVTNGVDRRSADHGRLGLGMVYAFLALGDAKYLASARGFADAVTNMQSGGLLTSNFSSTDAAGANRVNYGAWTRMTKVGVTSFDHVYQADSLVCLEFLSALMAVTGDEFHGADTTIAGLFTQAPQMLLSASMAAARAFWAVGAFDAVTNTTITGLSSTTPREFFNSFPLTKTAGFANGSGSWEFQDAGASTGTLVTASFIATALRSLFALDGYSATVSSLWTWLMAFGSNPTFSPTSTSRSQDAPTVRSFAGGYNAKLALSTLLAVRSAGASIALNGSNVYDWQCAGLLSAIQAAQDSGSLDTAKDAVTKGLQMPVDYDYGSNTLDYAMMQGLTGLGMQISTTTPPAIQWRADLAAVIGQMFRRGNKAFSFQI